jgi:hypothetical protein
MKPEDCLALLAMVLESTAVAVPEQSGLGRSARAVLKMAAAYESDGRTFSAAGDRVNALACAWYGFGWLHFGITYGFLTSTVREDCPFFSPCEALPPRFRDQLLEKTERYERLLKTARHAVRPAPEAGTAAGGFADRVLLIASVYAESGNRCQRSGEPEDALARYSYAHGWLDAGVTAGLFCITGHHELFTV